MTARPGEMTRRTVLLGAAGLAGSAALAACGSSGSPKTATLGGKTELALHDGEPVVIPLFDVNDPYLVTGAPQRMVLGLEGSDTTTAQSLPPTATFRVLRGQAPTGVHGTVAAHGDGTPVGYYPVRASFDHTGSHTLELTVGGRTTTQAVEVVAPDQTQMLQPGQKMRPVETPTPTDHRGVEPICTRSPACDLHSTTLAQALAAGKPTAFLIATPQFCQIGVCGPSLDLLLEQVAHYPDLQFLHAEVYTDAAKLGTYQGAKTSDAVNTYALTYEPALFLADAQGTLVERLDNVFDRAELKAGLDRLSKA
jgi:hypothetical protein